MSSIQFKPPKNNPEVIGRIHVNQSNNFNGIQVNTKKRGISVTNQKNSNSNQKKITLKSQTTNNNKLISNVITQVQPKTIVSKQITDPKNQTKSHSYSPNRLLNSQMKINGLLPPKISDKKTLVLDLDETLVHSGFLPFSCPSDVVIKIELENEIHDIHVLVRPGVKEFLEKMSKKYEIVIFTASLAKYADPLLDIIDKQGYCPFRLFREHCTLINTAFVKDLKRLGRELKDIIIVDNSPISYALNPDNGLPILSWFEDKNDRELYNITPVLEFLSEVNDVREYIKKIVVNNEINFTKAMSVINQFNNNKKKINENNELLNSIKNGNSNNNNKNIKNIIQAVENKNVENPQEINIKIINNNITNFICNNNNNNKDEEEKNKTGFSYNTLNKNKFTLSDKNKKNQNNFISNNNNSLKLNTNNNNLKLMHEKKETIHHHKNNFLKTGYIQNMNTKSNNNNNNNYINTVNPNLPNHQINITGIDFTKTNRKKNQIKYNSLLNKNSLPENFNSLQKSANLFSGKSQESLNNKKIINSKNFLHQGNNKNPLHTKSLSYNFDSIGFSTMRPKTSAKKITPNYSRDNSKNSNNNNNKNNNLKDIRIEINDILQKKGVSKSSRANDLRGGFKYNLKNPGNTMNGFTVKYTNKIIKEKYGK